MKLGTIYPEPENLQNKSYWRAGVSSKMIWMWTERLHSHPRENHLKKDLLNCPNCKYVHFNCSWEDHCHSMASLRADTERHLGCQLLRINICRERGKEGSGRRERPTTTQAWKCVSASKLLRSSRAKTTYQRVFLWATCILWHNKPLSRLL